MAGQAPRYRLEANIRHWGKDPEKVTIVGTFEEIAEELYSYQPEASAVYFEEQLTAGFRYWDDALNGAGDFDQEDPEDVAEAKAAGWVWDETNWLFVRAERRAHTPEALEAYAAHCLDVQETSVTVTRIDD